jgi:FkbM family methyltransferase
MMDLIVPRSTVVDVGGNLGSFTAFFAAATGLEGRVYSFEPQNKMFQASLRLKI